MRWRRYCPGDEGTARGAFITAERPKSSLSSQAPMSTRQERGACLMITLLEHRAKRLPGTNSTIWRKPVADAAEIVVVDARQPQSIGRMFAIPSVGRHGLDPDSHRLFCACDSAELITLDARSGKVLGRNP